MKELHVMNKHGFIFKIDPKTKIKAEDLTDCQMFDSEEAAQQAQAEKFGISLDEVTLPWLIQPSETKGIRAQVVCDRGSVNDIEGDPAEYVSNEHG